MRHQSTHKSPDSSLVATKRMEHGKHSCHHAGCQAEGLYPAPKSKSSPRPHLWFCKAHVIAYNQQWDWYEGMTESEIIKDQISDLTWRRPTYAMQNGIHRPEVNVLLEDPLAIFYRPHANHQPPSPKSKSHKSRPSANPDARYIPPTMPQLWQALQLLGLDNPVSWEEVKRSYRSLAHLHHPDKHNGVQHESTDTAHDFKQINSAYQQLKQWFQAS